ncbi:hypothetical protein J6590_090020 [Homalodisca vitripennis]|nr:hypothetical protein J6590_090020 [Homalodisca vitripennis]
MRVFKLQRQAIRSIDQLKFRESCKEALNLLLTLPSLYILETTLFCVSKCAITNVRDIHAYGTRGRDNYRTGRHRTVVYERLPSQPGTHLYSLQTYRVISVCKITATSVTVYLYSMPQITDGDNSPPLPGVKGRKSDVVYSQSVFSQSKGLDETVFAREGRPDLFCDSATLYAEAVLI